MCLERRWQMKQDDSFLQIFSERPLAFDVISDGMNPSLNGTLNGSISHEGVAFWADHEPRMNAIISVELDGGMMANCSEVERDLLYVGNSIVGKVASVERNELAKEIIVKMAFLRRSGAYFSSAEKENALV